METGFISVFWFLLISAITVPLMLGIGLIVRPRRKWKGLAGTSYECGELPVGSSWIKFNIRFYIVAIIFIIFDVELAAVFPVATIFKSAIEKGNGGLVFLEIFLFVALLLVGLVYCWMRGDLDWVKGLPAEQKIKKANV